MSTKKPIGLYLGTPLPDRILGYPVPCSPTSTLSEVEEEEKEKEEEEEEGGEENVDTDSFEIVDLESSMEILYSDVDSSEDDLDSTVDIDDLDSGVDSPGDNFSVELVVSIFF